jgi:hypothetical protein
MRRIRPRCRRLLRLVPALPGVLVTHRASLHQPSASPPNASCCQSSGAVLRPVSARGCSPNPSLPVTAALSRHRGCGPVRPQVNESPPASRYLEAVSAGPAVLLPKRFLLFAFSIRQRSGPGIWFTTPETRHPPRRNSKRRQRTGNADRHGRATPKCTGGPCGNGLSGSGAGNHAPRGAGHNKGEPCQRKLPTPTAPKPT